MRTALLALAIVLAPAALHAAPERVRPLPSSPGLVRFEVDVPEVRFDPVPGDPAAVLPMIDGYGANGVPGTPGIPMRVVMVAVPPEGPVTVRATASGTDVREGITLAPVPMVERAPDGSVSNTYARTPEAYAARTALAPERAKLLGVAWMRNQRVARIAILPLDYEPAARRVRLSRGVQVEVTVAAAPARPPAEPADGFEGMYRATLVNYAQGRDWRRPVGMKPGSRALPARLAQLQRVKDAIYPGREWIKLMVSESGFYKVTYGTLQAFGMFRGGVPATSLRVFTWPGIPMLPEDSYCDSCGYREVQIGIPGGITIFGDPARPDRNGDYFYFFALGPSDWANVYDSSQPDTTYFNHPYESQNYYYLTVSTASAPVAGPPLRIPTVAADVDTSGSPDMPTSFPARIHYEQNNLYSPDSPPVPLGTDNSGGRVDSLYWQKWFWTALDTQSPTYTMNVDLPQADLTQAVRFRIKLWGLSNFVRNNVSLDVNLQPVSAISWYNKTSATFDTLMPAPHVTGNALVLRVPSSRYPGSCTRLTSTSEICTRVGLAWADMFYQRQAIPVRDSLTFDAPASGRRTVYKLGPFTAPPRLFDVTDAQAPFEITGPLFVPLDSGVANPRIQVVFADQADRPRRFRLIPDGKIVNLIPPRVFPAPLTSLDTLRTLKADYVVIYYDGFAAAAESLVAWRRLHLPLDSIPPPYCAKAVPISALYDQFSGGRTDPMATRNFLRAVYSNSGSGTPDCTRIPTYITLLGDASFDYRNFTGHARAGQPPCLLPTYENGYDAFVLGGHQFTTDDWLLNVDDPTQIIPDFFGGRLPVGDPATAMDVVRNKVLLYERQPPFGEARNRVMLIADDNKQCDSPDDIGWGHLQQTSQLDQLGVPEHIDRDYVYLHTYPTQGTCSKPGARSDIRKNLEDGVAIWNYIGHGSPFQLTDEAVFIETDIGTLTNVNLPLFVAASCDVGLFNDPTNTSIGEALVTQHGGGAVAVISATQLAISFSNATLNLAIYKQLFNRDSSVTHQYHTSVAEALLHGKESAGGFGGLTNDMKFQLMGDAGTRLNLPRLWVELALQDSSGAPVTQLARGQLVQFTGRVVTAPGGPPVPITGKASMLIEDARPLDEPADCPGGCAGYDYYFKAGPIYRGDVAITNGLLQGRFLVPLEAREGPLGRVRAYVQGRSAGELVDTDGAGSLTPTVVTGASTSGDNEGPHISLSFAGGSTRVRAGSALLVDLFDPSGILITDHTPQNGIIVTVDNNSTTRADITESFRYAADSYQSGRATFELPSLSEGPHTVKVSAADNLASGFGALAHRSSATLDFEVTSTPPLSITRAYLFPNPTSSHGASRGGSFVIDAPGDSLNVLLRIYTVAGRLVRTLRSYGGFNQVQIPWDGLDEDQSPLANGVYLFRVNVNSRDPGGASSAREHASADGRFVIVNR